MKLLPNLTASAVVVVCLYRGYNLDSVVIADSYNAFSITQIAERSAQRHIILVCHCKRHLQQTTLDQHL